MSLLAQLKWDIVASSSNSIRTIPLAHLSFCKQGDTSPLTSHTQCTLLPIFLHILCPAASLEIHLLALYDMLSFKRFFGPLQPYSSSKTHATSSTKTSTSFHVTQAQRHMTPLVRSLLPIHPPYSFPQPIQHPIRSPKQRLGLPHLLPLWQRTLPLPQLAFKEKASTNRRAPQTQSRCS